MNLVIVESAAKAKTIEKYLNSIQELNHLGKFKVIASLGHIQDLPEKEIGVDSKTWNVTYVPLKTKNKVLQSLKTEIKNASMVYLASDMDLEGNAIAYHLKTYFKLQKPKYVRIIFNEITKTALKQAILNPTDIDMNMFAAQETRRILDRIVGYEVSPLLWRRFVTQTLSAGRVQSAGLQMITTRYKNLLEHNPESYWMCEGDFILNNISLKTSIYSKETNQIMYWSTNDNLSFEKFLNKIVTNKLPWITEIKTKTVYKNPSAPFTTSKFQQEVYNLYRIPPKVAMMSAQKLYEGGYITYMRTDSVQLSEEAQKNIITYIKEHFTEEYIQPRTFKNSQENAQEAHEAIRPSNINVLTNELPNETFTDSDRKIYSLIRRRTLSSQMIPAEYLEISYTIDIPNEQYYFNGKQSILIKKGYLEVYSPDIKIDTDLIKLWNNIIKTPKHTVTLDSLQGIPIITKAQALYNESSIIKSFEKEGIGRPSTYAKIIDTLYNRKYIIKSECPEKTVLSKQYEWVKNTTHFLKKDITLTTGSKDKDFLIPTSLGIRVIEYLEPVVPFLLDVTFTSHMETDLDKIMKGVSDKNKVLNDFYEIFHTAIEKAKQEMKSSPKEKKEHKLYPKEDSIIHKYNDNLLVVKTKYGPSLLDVSNSKWYSIKPYIEWKKKDYKDITNDELQFIMSLPLKIINSERILCLGPYGFYIKDTVNNYILPEEHWEKACNGLLDSEYINSLQPHYSKKSPPVKEKEKEKKQKPKKASVRK